MDKNKELLLKVLNEVMLNATNLIDQLINYDTGVNNEDVSNAKKANDLLRDLEILEELPF